MALRREKASFHLKSSFAPSDHLADLREMAATDIADLRASAQALRSPVGGWRPIETAPKDGRPVLLGRDMGDPWGWVTGWGEWFDHNGISGWVTRGGFYEPPGVLGLGDPTHWAPLPTPPLSQDPVAGEPSAELIERVARAISGHSEEVWNSLGDYGESIYSDTGPDVHYPGKLDFYRKARAALSQLCQRGRGE